MPRTEIERLRAAMALAVSFGAVAHISANAGAIAAYLAAAYPRAGCSAADIRAELLGLAARARARTGVFGQ